MNNKKLYQRWYVWVIFYPIAIYSYCYWKYKEGNKIPIMLMLVVYVCGLGFSILRPKSEVVEDNAPPIVIYKPKICYIYGQSLQACATAGDFSTCMDIKDPNWQSHKYFCNGDGTVHQY